ncbi:hypothetical protein HJB84_25650 [Rhizobium sp. NZLR1b]|uniref:DNA cytosine methyltransferase n=1 Tax=Rhizobium sp. NZLR1b TaxID=2731099 RepID=UPI001C82D217|nr:DNA cytosine methyltransferase [Rhizobium sp. NZLR1b]MBX5173210.1 hypothetical protein [Rhizobium sp. NZLR1b]
MTAEKTSDDLLQETVLREAVAALRQINNEIAERYMAAASVVDALSRHNPDHVAAYLSKHAGLGPEDVEYFQKIASGLSGPLRERFTLLGESQLSIKAIEALALAPAAVQRKVLRILDAGQLVRSDEISKLEDQHLKDSMPEWARWEEERRAALKSLASPTLDIKIAKLESYARSISDKLHRFKNYWDHEEFELEEGLYDLCHRDLVAIASEALPVFEDLFGDLQSLERSGGEHAPNLVGAYSAFQQVAEGCFGYKGGLKLHQDIGLGEIGLEDAVDLLVPYDGDGRSSIFQSTAPLRVLELCAGAGGLALGLQSAGFRHVALYDNHKPSIESLKRNQPHWPAQLADINEIPDEVLLRFEGIDLLAAGLPSGPGQDGERKPDLHPRMMDILQIVRPRAFIIENDAGVRKRPSVSDARTATAAALSSMGYVVTDFSLDTAEFGLPHSTERSFLVGIDAEISRVFEQPQVMTRTVGQMEKAIAKAATEDELEEAMKIRPGYRRGVGAALASVIAVHATPRRVEGQSDQQKTYDRWAKHWKGEYLTAMLPDIPEKTEKRSADGWSASGFRHAEIVDAPPSLEEADNENFKPKLTYGVLAAAQGFPAPWQFLAEGNGKLRMIQAALPPIMSKMVGLAVRAVMTGESFDLDEEVKATVIEDSKVGPQREGFRQAVARRRSRLPSNEIHAQAVRVLDGEELRAVEPNHKKRTAVKAMMARVQDERNRDAEAERFRQDWHDSQHDIRDGHSFPEGLPA